MTELDLVLLPKGTPIRWTRTLVFEGPVEWIVGTMQSTQCWLPHEGITHELTPNRRAMCTTETIEQVIP